MTRQKMQMKKGTDNNRVAIRLLPLTAATLSYNATSSAEVVEW